MGAYSPAPVATPAITERILKESLQPTIDGMRREGVHCRHVPYISLYIHILYIGFPFVGLLFTGFMLTKDGPKVLEYNVRFGDPETEALLLLLAEDTDLASIFLVRLHSRVVFGLVLTTFPCQACVEHRLDSVKINIRSGFAVSVVLASAGYPASYQTGKPITIGSTSGMLLHHTLTPVHAQYSPQVFRYSMREQRRTNQGKS